MEIEQLLQNNNIKHELEFSGFASWTFIYHYYWNKYYYYIYILLDMDKNWTRLGQALWIIECKLYKPIQPPPTHTHIRMRHIDNDYWLMFVPRLFTKQYYYQSQLGKQFRWNVTKLNLSVNKEQGERDEISWPDISSQKPFNHANTRSQIT